MKWITIILMALALSSCSVVESVIDPAGYTQRQTAQADARRSEADAERSRNEADTERSRSEAQRAQADAQAAESKATADQATAAAFAQLGDAIKAAGEPNNAPVIVAMLLIACVSGWAVWNSRQVTVQTIAASRPLLSPPAAVQLLAEQQGLNAVHDGQRWLLLDENGTVVQRQRLMGGIDERR